MIIMATHKPSFHVDQLVSSSDASKKFGELRKRAKLEPQFITENGSVDTVLVGYDYFEKMYQRLKELEEREEEQILTERIARLEADPESAVSWKAIRRSGQSQ
jgi:PHD/YefM family antitoxin component YafN of YafNO toxin-antitoxin module